MNYPHRLCVQLAPVTIRWGQQAEIEERLHEAGFDIFRQPHITLQTYKPDDNLVEQLSASLERIASRYSKMTLRILGVGTFKDKGVVCLSIEKTRALQALQSEIINMTTPGPWISTIRGWKWTPHISIARIGSNSRQWRKWEYQPHQSGEIEAKWLELTDWDKLDKRYELAI